METVFVTGANGLLGTNIVVELLKQNYKVKALVRKRRNYVAPKHTNLEIIEGNICIVESIEPQLKNCDYVIHSAAITAQNLLNPGDYYKVNVQGTKNIIELCKKHNIKRLVYIGTANTIGFGSRNNLGDEEKPISYPFSKSNYVISKNHAQQLIDKANEHINTITICPTFMLGEYDSKPSSGKIILMSYNKKLVFYPPGGKNFVHVKDVALASIKALKQGKSGEKYLLANENLSYKDFFVLLSKKIDKKQRFIKIPSLFLKIIGFVGDLLRLLKVKTELSSVNMKILIINNFYTNKKAQQEFQIYFESTEKATMDAIEWFKKNDMV